MGCQITMVQIVTSALLDYQNKNTLIPPMMFLDDLNISTDNNKANLYNMNFHSSSYQSNYNFTPPPIC